MRIYKHIGPGHHVGSAVVVQADCIESAKELIEYELINNGLPDEELNITDMGCSYNECKVLYVDNGDY